MPSRSDLEALLAAGAQGEWIPTDDGYITCGDSYVLSIPEEDIDYDAMGTSPLAQGNAALAAGAKNALPGLLEIVALQEKVLKRVSQYTIPGDDESSCPICGRYEHMGHYEGCELHAALKAVRDAGLEARP